MTPLQIRCPRTECGKKLSFTLAPDSPPKKGRCPSCGAVFSIAPKPVPPPRPATPARAALPPDDLDEPGLAPLEPSKPFQRDLEEEEEGGSYGLAQEHGLAYLLRRDQDGFHLSAQEKASIRRLIDEGLASNPRRCPACEASLARKAVLCVACGLNFKTGRRLQTTVEAAPEQKPGEQPTAADAALTVADVVVTLLGG